MRKIFILLFLMLFSVNLSAQEKFDFLYDDFQISLKNVRIIGDELKIDFIATNSGKNSVFSYYFSDTKVYDDKGKQYTLKSASIGNKIGGVYSVLATTMIRNVPLNGSITFELNGETFDRIKLLELPIVIQTGYKNFKSSFKNVPIPFKLNNPYPESEKTVKFEKKSILIEDDIYFNLTAVKIIGEELRFEYHIDNKSKKPFNAAFFVGQCRVIDSYGVEFEPDNLLFGSEEGGSLRIVRAEVPADFQIHGYLSIILQDAFNTNMAKLLEISINDKPFYIFNVGLSN